MSLLTTKACNFVILGITTTPIPWFSDHCGHLIPSFIIRAKENKLSESLIASHMFKCQLSACGLFLPFMDNSRLEAHTTIFSMAGLRSNL